MRFFVVCCQMLEFQGLVYVAETKYDAALRTCVWQCYSLLQGWPLSLHCFQVTLLVLALFLH
jgi:hypothetical protein